MAGASGRSGTHEFQQNRQSVLLRDGGICALCGHPDARTVDHIVSAPDWPRDLEGKMVPGFDGMANLQAAHGSMGSNATRKEPDNRCWRCDHVKGRLCNQSKGDGRRAPRISTNSRRWL